MDCCSPGDSAFDRQFDARHAARKLRAYRRKGPVGLTRALIEALAAGGIDGYTVLDIGGGVGAVHHELLRFGAATAVDVDASRAYLSVAREESERQGHAGRARYLIGDFVAPADEVDPPISSPSTGSSAATRHAALVGRSATRRGGGMVSSTHVTRGSAASASRSKTPSSVCRGRPSVFTPTGRPMSTRSSPLTASSSGFTGRR
jgi:predicted RNA methylase